eukprot:TRINITY_DN4857_c0_g1_i1.p1 TRINITY_DN4857_c0_g1~~TRINITY_DN4857_c0_g1_i1.p1  ORF type:complete len:341 (-),score=74.11 TRINITY_DN4857_c0_g1_i1:112-1134(-)
MKEEIVTRLSKDGSDEIIYIEKDSINYLDVEHRFIKGPKLGKGSYATVRECYDIKENKRCAVKIFSKRKLSKMIGDENKITREIQFLKNLDHFNCVAFYGSFENEDKEKTYFFLEFLGGGTLHNLVKKNGAPLPLAQSRKYFYDLINGVEYLHSTLKVVHRDIKPENLLLSYPDGVVKISDFDCASEISEVVKHSGSPAFQPPEVANSEENIDATKVDIWACGVVLFFLITSEYPFSEKTTNLVEMLENVSKANYKIPSNIDDVASDLIKSILEKDYNKRFTISQIKSHLWMSKEFKLPNESFVKLTPIPTSLNFRDESSHVIDEPPDISDNSNKCCFIC